MFAVSTMAAIIASQAMISATYSMIRNAMALGCFPRVTVIHTSKSVHGQIYIPEINWTIMILSISIVAGFRSTTQIGHAYGVSFFPELRIATQSEPKLLIASSVTDDFSSFEHTNPTTYFCHSSNTFHMSYWLYVDLSGR